MSFTPPAPSAPQATVASLSDVGRHRSENQDNLLVQPLPDALLLAVCDGMGGGQGGEIASALATTTLRHALICMEPPYTRETLGRALDQGLQGAHEVVRSTAESRRLRDMGTTATAALIAGNMLVIGQVGDSRAYLLRGGAMVRLTRDQSLAQQLLEQGVLRPEDLRTFEHGNIILQAVGSASGILVDLTWAELRRGDTLMLCSDGLWNELEEERIADLLNAHSDPEEACRTLINAANEAGGSDNVTCIVARFESASLPLPEPTKPLPGYQKLMFQDLAPEAFPLPARPSEAPREVLVRENREEIVERPSSELPMHPPHWLGAALVVAGAVLGVVLLWCS